MMLAANLWGQLFKGLIRLQRDYSENTEVVLMWGVVVVLMLGVTAVAIAKLAPEMWAWGKASMLNSEESQACRKNVASTRLSLSVRWYRLAAEQGDADAQCMLGDAYHRGIGVPEDDVEAVKWYRKAADPGLARAQYSLGNAYYTGRGVEQDYVEAVKWYRLSADQ